jgi:YHS domain-containing protein
VIQVIRLLIWALLIYIGYRIIISLTSPKGESPDVSRVQRNDAEATHRDPVCGVYVTEDDAVVGTLDGRRHYFCSHSCLEKFQEQLNHKS